MGKSLQLNQTLCWLSIDRNQIGPDGFLELARAFQMNTTLQHMQLPISDLTDSMIAVARSPLDRNRLLLVLNEIEQALERNAQLETNGPTQRQLAMKAIHLLNNVRYFFNSNNNTHFYKISLEL